ncbi:glycosyltransferase family 39 protein [Kamptonema sp. UHCC 0994]|uniref:glycosyltransferase family 39 protein n=1 Tax=Kamptonema sp. UHCC 0994 TaxID=3031329 RepID=UPI0023B9F834|nr:glycosyltransferase family 39 protein [Kamptonema sp. UHCC 0994]MDF0552568.1 glycosyltransferase family 39 protein [Kamptonema sp. UHCC 0994]
MATISDKFINGINLRLLVILLVIAIIIGVGFRFFQIDHKLYWHDEVYTSIRAAGFTRQEIDNNLFQNRIIAASELQNYQKLKPGSTAADTIRSLVIEDPQHPPFYFLMARLWMQQFGSSLTASRTLPALLSLLAFPLMYGLAWELFSSHLVALFATAFIALSPFDILFAQTARQYSLLAVIVIGSSWLLLRAIRLENWKYWGYYSLSIALGLYTHPFFALTIIGQGAFLISQRLFITNFKNQGAVNLSKFFLAVIAAILLYSPWIFVLITNFQRASDTTGWTQISPGFLYLVKLWLLSFTAIFVDLDFGFDNVWTYLLRLPFFLLIFAAIYNIYRQTNRSTTLFIITSIFVPFLILVLPDIILGGKRSAVSRYLVSCFPGIQLAVGYFLATKIQTSQRLWRVILAAIFTASIISCTVSAFSDTWWSKDLSYYNAEVAKIINNNQLKIASTKSQIVIADSGDDFTNMGDLISLSYLLDKDVQLLLLSDSPNLDLLKGYADFFVFRPSEKLHLVIEQKQGKLEPVLEYARLWKLKL